MGKALHFPMGFEKVIILSVFPGRLPDWASSRWEANSQIWGCDQFLLSSFLFLSLLYQLAVYGLWLLRDLKERGYLMVEMRGRDREGCWIRHLSWHISGFLRDPTHLLLILSSRSRNVQGPTRCISTGSLLSFLLTTEVLPLPLAGPLKQHQANIWAMGKMDIGPLLKSYQHMRWDLPHTDNS